jgi:hypothetical protein
MVLFRIPHPRLILNGQIKPINIRIEEDIWRRGQSAEAEMARSLSLFSSDHACFRADADEDGDAAGGESWAPAFVLVAVVGLGAHFD